MIKKTACAALCFILSLTFITSCSERKVNTNDFLLYLCEIFSEDQKNAVLYGTQEQEDFKLMTPEDAGRLYLGRWESPNCYNRIQSMAVRLPLDDSGFEIHIIKGLNRSDSSELSALLQKRTDKIQNSEIKQYAPENYQEYYVGAEIYSYKGYIFLLATPNNRAVKKAIRAYL